MTSRRGAKQPSISDLQAEFYNQLKTAEDCIKEAEICVDFDPENISELSCDDTGLLFPAVNELRYVSYHLGVAITSKNAEEVISSYRAAIQHCKRSTYDSLNTLLQYYISACRCFQQDYKLVKIADVIPNYIEDCRKLNQISKSIPARAKDSVVEAFYSKMRPYLNTVRDIYEKWETSRIELNKYLEEANAKRTEHLLKCIGILVTIVGTVISGLFWLFRWFFYSFMQ